MSASLVGYVTHQEVLNWVSFFFTSLESRDLIKGQLNSKCPFGVIVWAK